MKGTENEGGETTGDEEATAALHHGFLSVKSCIPAVWFCIQTAVG
jgi:hypothetical protein